VTSFAPGRLADAWRRRLSYGETRFPMLRHRRIEPARELLISWLWPRMSHSRSSSGTICNP